jgi:predicted peptidase
MSSAGRGVTKLVLVALLSTAVSILSAAADSSGSSRPAGRWIDGEFVSSMGIVIPYQVWMPPEHLRDGTYRFGPDTHPLVVFLTPRPPGGTGTRATAESDEVELRDPLSTCPECSLLFSVGAARHYSALVAVVYLRGAPTVRDREEELEALIELATSDSSLQGVDDRRIYLTGHDSCAVVAWELAARVRSLFAALVPAGGGADPRLAPRLTATAVWAFHASVDPRPVAETRTMIGAIWAAGGNRARYSEFHSGGGNSWLRAWSDPIFVAWLFSQTRVSP